MRVYSTKELCDTLGVNRTWVNTHLRQLGGAPPPPNKRPKGDLRTIYYSENDVVKWLQQHARFSRQTKYIDLCDYIPKSKLDTFSESTEEVSDTQKDVDFYDFLLQYFTEDTVEAIYKVLPRRRGLTAWTEEKHTIKFLDSLNTMVQLQDKWGVPSQETVYRTIFSTGMVKVEVIGRTWFMKEPENKNEMSYPFLVPAGLEIRRKP